MVHLPWCTCDSKARDVQPAGGREWKNCENNGSEQVFPDATRLPVHSDGTTPVERAILTLIQTDDFD